MASVLVAATLAYSCARTLGTPLTTPTADVNLARSPPRPHLLQPDDETNPGAVAGLNILEYPHPLLRAANDEVETFDEALADLARRMFTLMYASRGVGLAAPQVGVNKRLMVFNPDGDPKRWMSEVVLCNPTIVESSSRQALEEEGCLSFPGFVADVRRPSVIKVEYQNAKGKKQKKKLSGWEARIFQHEYDHLDGVLYVDRLDDAWRGRVQPKLDDLIRAHGPGGAI